MHPKTPAALLPENAARPCAASLTYLDDLQRELLAWDDRLRRARTCAPKGSRAARVEQRKRLLVSRIRSQNLELRIAQMRDAPEARFQTLQPGLQLLWRLFKAGVESAEG